MIGAHKLGDVVLRSMWSHYLIKSGYTKQALANVDKGVGILATILGIHIGVKWINRHSVASGFRFGATRVWCSEWTLLAAGARSHCITR